MKSYKALLVLKVRLRAKKRITSADNQKRWDKKAQIIF
jgi:hypothetical protein